MSACELQLIAEAKVRYLLGNPVERRFEASEVCVRGKECYVVRGAILLVLFLVRRNCNPSEAIRVFDAVNAAFLAEKI